MTNLVLKSCILCIEGRELSANLVLLDMHDFDDILGMDWLASYHVIVHCFEKEVVFRPPSESKFVFKVSCLPFMPRVISCIQANCLLRKGCQGFLASVVVLQSKELVSQKKKKSKQRIGDRKHSHCAGISGCFS